jgi:hypothetical protein
METTGRRDKSLQITYVRGLGRYVSETRNFAIEVLWKSVINSLLFQPDFSHLVFKSLAGRKYEFMYLMQLTVTWNRLLGATGLLK